jgi:MoxR-like ATPase
MNRELQTIIVEVEKAVVGKREVIEKILMALLADGHVLLDDIPGVGKTTLAVALSRTLGLTYNRIQFTPDVLWAFPFTTRTAAALSTRAAW